MLVKGVKNTQCMMIERKMRGIRALGDKCTKCAYDST